MKELVERFIREHRYKIKSENEYVLTFMINNALHDLTVCTSYDVLEQKYKNLFQKSLLLLLLICKNIFVTNFLMLLFLLRFPEGFS